MTELFKRNMLYLAALLFLGIGYIALVPPYEGFDENAHFSSLRQIADTGTIPVYGQSFFPADVAGYKGPVPFGSLEPPFDKDLVYSKFFAEPQNYTKFQELYRTPRQPITFEPSQTPNWQAQHPPLYYLLLAPFTRLTEGLSFTSQFFLLRLLSYFLALAGVMFGLRAGQEAVSRPDDPDFLNGYAAYPVIFPMMFPEFARLGNDSLCLFLAGLVALFLTRYLQAPHKTGPAVALGITLGLGLLTKAFFIPMTVAVLGFLILRQLRAQQGKVEPVGRWRTLLLIAGVALLLGGGWYAYKYIVYHDIIGGNDAIHLADKGGFVANMQEHFSLLALARGVVVTLVTWSWTGTWSLARLPAILHLPLLAFTLGVLGVYVATIRKRPATDAAWFPIWLMAIFGAGLFYHILISLAINGNGNTPGYYLHVLLPWMAPALGMGLAPLLKGPRIRWLCYGFMIYAVLFHLVQLWAQFTLYTGCAVKGDTKHYVFTGHAFCMDQLGAMVHNLAIIGWPLFAGAGFSVGFLLLAYLNVLQVRTGKSVH